MPTRHWSAAVAEGHAIGNHSYDHPTMTRLDATQQAAQMDLTTRYISAAVVGGYRPCFFRPPYGTYGPTTLTLARKRGMRMTLWSHDTQDWRTPLSPSSSFQLSIVHRATNPVSLHPHVLMHDGSPGNYRQNIVDSVQRIIRYYQARDTASPTRPGGSRPTPASGHTRASYRGVTISPSGATPSVRAVAARVDGVAWGRSETAADPHPAGGR